MTHYYHQQQHRRRVLMGLLLGAAAVILRPKRRQPCLTRASLLSPSLSAAAHLLHARKDSGYISVFGLDVKTFDLLLAKASSFFPPPPLKVRRPRLLSVRAHLALTLYYLTTPQRQKSISIVFGIVPSAVSPAIWVGLRALRVMMEADPDYWAIRWPSPDTMKSMAAAVRAREPLLKHVFGFVDGLNLRIYQPGDVDEQNAYYNGWLADTYCSQVLVFLPNGEIAWTSFNCPGSWHDSKIAAGLYKLLTNPTRTPGSFAVLADSAFPYTAEIAGRILSRPKDKIVGKETDVSKLRLWEAVTRQRQSAEWGMRALQGAFGRLDLRLPVHKTKRALLLYVVFRLHNFRTRIVGLNQIKEVYFPEWQARPN
ncbi:unnamed protein product [Tilletia controversa]|nr:hypothetical protein CF336_g6798 [Tilletia laevis]CAD6897921.1 unnamed protein product [Tilletia controversa]KAE8191221.1 hypothetical protein CF335_g6146 [Tilletia laevis]CAD6937479.1 unnamed protein product [Tilletia controversa]CAD6942920.1 unnamed protein product [Tilletia controversa]